MKTFKERRQRWRPRQQLVLPMPVDRNRCSVHRTQSMQDNGQGAFNLGNSHANVRQVVRQRWRQLVLHANKSLSYMRGGQCVQRGRITNQESIGDGSLMYTWALSLHGNKPLPHGMGMVHRGKPDGQVISSLELSGARDGQVVRP